MTVKSSLAAFIELEAKVIMDLKATASSFKKLEEALKDDLSNLMDEADLHYYQTPDSAYSASLYLDRVGKKIKRSDTGFNTPLVIRDMTYSTDEGSTRRLFTLDLLMRLCSVNSDGVSDVVKAKYLSEADAMAIFVRDRVSVKPSLMIRPKVITD